MTTSEFIQTTERWAFTSSWTHQLCVHGGRWSLCAGHGHADWRRNQGELLVSSMGTFTSAPRLNKQVLPPEVPEPTVGPDLLQPLQIFSQLVVQTVGQNLKQKRDFNLQSMKKVKAISTATAEVHNSSF